MFAPHLEEGEKILHVTHRHPFLMVNGGIKIIFLGFIVPVFFWNVFPEIWLIFFIWVLVAFVQLNKLMFNWYYDSLLITTTSVVDVSWNGPFHRTSERLEYSNIEGVTYSFIGVLQTVGNYGDLQVNKQGGTGGLVLKDSINPIKVEKILMDYQKQYLEQKNMTEATKLKGLLSELVAKHVKDGEIEVNF